ncbi:hypothetical protein Tco_1064661 [Tanacetum coccineum]
MVFNSPCLTDKKELIHHEGTAMVPLRLELIELWFQFLADMCRLFKYSSQASSILDVAAKFIFQSSRYVVPTGRVVVPTGRYVVPAGKVIIIVSPGRLSLVPTGRVLSPGRVK